jgi:chromate transporter
VPARQVSLATIFQKFATIGAVSFGGGIVAYLQRLLVDDTKWLTDDEFLTKLEIAQTMPGLNAVNMCILVGDELRGPIGAFVGVMGILAAQAHAAYPVAHAALAGISAGAVGLLSAITWHTGKKQFLKPLDLALLLMTFVLMSIVKWPLWVILLVMGPIAILAYRPGSKGNA